MRHRLLSPATALGLAALLPLACYDGTRGKANIKWLFYLYYPLHLAAIYGISLLL